jgi:hypothetical protein
MIRKKKIFDFNLSSHFLFSFKIKLRLTTVQSTSVDKLNLHPNSPNIQLRVNKLLLKNIIPTKKTKKRKFDVEKKYFFLYRHTRMNNISNC